MVSTSASARRSPLHRRPRNSGREAGLPVSIVNHPWARYTLGMQPTKEQATENKKRRSGPHLPLPAQLLPPSPFRFPLLRPCSLPGQSWRRTGQSPATARPAACRPLIDCTDLYHPHRDPGDNVDLLAAYALPEVDLKAVILDVTQQYRTEGGRRDAGFIPVLQLNSIFNRNVPCGVTPYAKMKSPDDPMLGAAPLPAIRRGIAASRVVRS